MNKRLAVLIAGFFTVGDFHTSYPPATPTAAAAPAKPDATKARKEKTAATQKAKK